jgi:hypothetical protein
MWRNRFGGGFGLVVRQNIEWLNILTSSINLRSFIYVFYVRLPVNDLKKIETCQSISGSYVNVYNTILVHCSVLSTKLLINPRTWILLTFSVALFGSTSKLFVVYKEMHITFHAILQPSCSKLDSCRNDCHMLTDAKVQQAWEMQWYMQNRNHHRFRTAILL